MLGIDIVDLKDPLLKERDNRSLNLIKNDGDTIIEHPQLFWLLWSAKEAVFKFNREPFNFTPTSIPIQIREEAGKFTFRSEQVAGKIEITSEYILAYCGNLEDMDHHLFEKDDDDWSLGIRKMILEYFKSKGKEYTIGSDDLNLPIINPPQSVISISHHGRYGAVAYSKKLI